MKNISLIVAVLLCVALVFVGIFLWPFNTATANMDHLAAGGSADLQHTSNQAPPVSTVYFESAPIYSGVSRGADSLASRIARHAVERTSNSAYHDEDYPVNFNLGEFEPDYFMLPSLFVDDDFGAAYVEGVDSGVLAANRSVRTPFSGAVGLVNDVNPNDFERGNIGGPGSFPVSPLRTPGNATPEPASLVLIGLGVSALSLMRKAKLQKG